MNIDVHAHYLPPRYMEMLRAGGGPVFGAAHGESTLLAMIEGQNDAGIALQILSTGPSSPYMNDARLAAEAAHEVNDAYKDVTERYPRRFAAFGSVPLPHGEPAAAEAIRCLDVLGFAGVHMGCSALGQSLDDPSFSDMWSELDRRDAVIYIHPGGILCGSEPGLAGMDDAGIAVTIGSAAELATAALRLAALCRSHRRLRIIIGLLGGSLPFLIQRVMWLGSRFKGKSILANEDGDSILTELRRFSFDTNLLPDPASLVVARHTYGLDRLVFGSDAPAVAPAVTMSCMREAGLTDEEFVEVLDTNPKIIFGDRFGSSCAPAAHSH